MAAEAELIHYVSQVTFLHSDHSIARLENSQETTSIENGRIIDYLNQQLLDKGLARQWKP